MTYEWDADSRKRILGEIAQHIHNQGVTDLHNFSQRIVAIIAAKIEKSGEFPKENQIRDMLQGLKSYIFTANSGFAKNAFGSWLTTILESENSGAIRPRQKNDIIPSGAKISRISIDDIDSFKNVKKIAASDVKNYVPLNLPESQIKQSIAEILGEPFISNDWGGETADLFSSHVVYQGKRLATGFLLKGPAIKGTLKIKNLGKNGDQVVRMTNVTLDLYIIQFVGPIDQNVIEHLESQVVLAAQKAMRGRYYCLIDGTDTARLLKAYKKL
jgi:hypothetical protein